jgi:hypothetical protein
MVALLLTSSASLGPIAIFSQTLSSQSATSNNTTSIENTTAAGRTGRGNNVAEEEAGISNDTTTMIASINRIWSQAANNSAEAARATEMSNNTANTGATNASDNTMQGRPNPTNTMNATPGYNNAGSTQGRDLATLSELLSQARAELVKGAML